MLATVFIVAAFVAIGVTIPLVIFSVLRKAESGGFGFFARRQMRREGTRARATILDLVIPSKPYGEVAHQSYQLVVEVRGADGGTWRARLVVAWNWEKWSDLSQGMELPVLVSSRQPGRVMIDYDSLRRERNAVAMQKHAADEARQRAMLGGGR